MIGFAPVAVIGDFDESHLSSKREMGGQWRYFKMEACVNADRDD